MGKKLATIALVASMLFNSYSLNSKINDKYDISFLWHHNLDAVLDYKEEISKRLSSISEKLIIVKGKKNFGLVYDRDTSSQERADTIAKSLYDKFLKNQGFEEPTGIKDAGYQPVHNVSFLSGKSLEGAIKEYNKIFKILSEKYKKFDSKNFVIEENQDEQKFVVYKSYLNENEAIELAKIIKSETELETSITRETGRDIIYNSSLQDLDDIILEQKKEQKSAKKVVKKKTKPETKLSPDCFEDKIDALYKQYKEDGLVAKGEKVAICVYDFYTDTKVVSINEDIPMQCASMVKPLVVLAYYHQLSKGKLKKIKSDKGNLRNMINYTSNSRSANKSTNKIMRRLGGFSAVDKILKNNYGGIFQQTRIVEEIPPGGATRKNKASAHDYSRFLYALWNNQLPYSDEIIRLMGLPNRDRIYTGNNIPGGLSVIDKTGSTATVCGNMGIIVAKDKKGNKRPYIIVEIIQRKSPHTNLYGFYRRRGKAMRKVSEWLYHKLMSYHNRWLAPN